MSEHYDEPPEEWRIGVGGYVEPSTEYMKRALAAYDRYEVAALLDSMGIKHS